MLYIEPLSKIPPVAERYAYNPRKSYLFPMQRLCNGLKVGLTLIAARPRMGCSTFAFSLAMKLAKEGARIMYCAHRQHQIISIRDRYKKSDPEPNTFKNLPFFYTEMYHPRTFEDLETNMWTAVREKQISYIFVDCLQEFEVDERICINQSQEEYLCKKLRELSYMLDVPIIALTHLSRRPDYRCGADAKVPQLGDFRGGDLALYTNQIYFLYRPAYYRINKDEKTGEDIRNQMFVYAMGGIDGLNEEFRLTFDHMGGRVSDGFDEVTPPPAAAPSPEPQEEKNDLIIVGDLPF